MQSRRSALGHVPEVDEAIRITGRNEGGLLVSSGESLLAINVVHVFGVFLSHLDVILKLEAVKEHRLSTEGVLADLRLLHLGDAVVQEFDESPLALSVHLEHNGGLVVAGTNVGGLRCEATSQNWRTLVGELLSVLRLGGVHNVLLSNGHEMHRGIVSRKGDPFARGRE